MVSTKMKGAMKMEDELFEEEKISTSGGIVGVVGDVVQAVDGFVVGTAKGVVSIVSPGLAKRLVSIDRNFKHMYGNILKGSVNFGLGIFGLSIK